VGPLTVPPAGFAYVDANAFVYTVERIAPYRALLDPFWRDVRASGTSAVTSEMTLLEVLVQPLRQGDVLMESAFRAVLATSPDVRMVPIARGARARGRTARRDESQDARRHSRRDCVDRGMYAVRDQRRLVSPCPGLNVTVLRDLLPPEIVWCCLAPLVRLTLLPVARAAARRSCNADDNRARARPSG